jgi:hypothetical protein
MDNKRGQAALEFLTTYGWAFMVILLMIGALAYFGVLNPDRFLPQRCNVGPEFSCNEYKVEAASGVLSVKFSNNVGQTILVKNVIASWDKQDLEDGCIWKLDDEPADATTQFSATEEVEILCTFNPALFPPIGNKIKFSLDIEYLPAGRSYDQPLAVEIFATLQEGSES